MRGRICLRRFVKGASTAAGALGLAALAFDLISFSYSWRSAGSGGEAQGRSSLISLGIEPLTAAFIGLAAVLCVLIAISGWGAAAAKSPLYLVGIVLCAVGLLSAAFFGGWFIGPSLLPAAGIGLLAAAASLVLQLYPVRQKHATRRAD